MHESEFNELLKTIGDFNVSLESIFEEHEITKFSSTQLTHLCLKAVEYDGDDLTSVPKPINGIPFSTTDYYAICTKAVENTGKALAHVPIELRDFALCFKAVKQHGFALEFVPSSSESKIQEQEYIRLWNESVKTYGLALEKIPLKYRNASLCNTAVLQNPLAFKWVPNPAITKDSVLSREEYINICFSTIKTDGLLLERMINDPLIDPPTLKQLTYFAVKHNARTIEFANPSLFTEMEYRDLCMMAVKYNGLALQYIPAPQNGKPFSTEYYFTLCKAAVGKDAEALQYVVNDELKKKIIDSVTPFEILANSYTAINYFPKGYENLDEINYKFLSGIEHVVIASNGNAQQKEIRDSYLAYANKSKRKGKTLFIYSEDLENFLNYMNSIKLLQSLNLVMLDHFQQYNEQICGKNSDDIINLLRTYLNINRVTLLGCATAKSKPLVSEKALFTQLKHEFDGIKKDACSLVLSSLPLEEKKASKILETQKNPTYFLYKNKDEYILEYRASGGKKELVSLSQKQVDQLFNVLGKPNHQFPEKGHELFSSLNSKVKIELWALRTTMLASFKSNNSTYQQRKSIFPFLTKGVLQPEDIEKLEESLLKKLFLEITNTPDIQRPITLKGYTQGIYVDVQNNRFYFSDTNIYSQGYSQSLFATSEESIDDKELTALHNRLLAAMFGEEIGSETKYKSLIGTTMDKSSNNS
ncbi:DUF4116 domain-containing protein [Legionella brunensis]|uniref:DUF4116 domain-containing protein n=1 Tax=Legionella brunensis TaxID=29422 RepID=A0A0W0S349_9GAMM|nr:DUF4116 domain-containing protein [Legionella brunensis]KTC77907.1 hypothetical protein Lbru_2800 [Legionella brunensis]